MELSAFSCPCCGRAVPGDFLAPEYLPFLIRAPLDRRLIDALVAAFPKDASLVKLVDHLYFDDPDGGPDAPEACVTAAAHRVRKNLKPFGWTITSRSSGGRTHGRVLYCLEPDRGTR